MLSTVLPPMSACTPQELLPIMPPSVQRLCVAGSGAKVSSCFSASMRSASRTMPGSTRAGRGACVEVDDRVHVLRKIEYDGNVAGLAGDAGSSSACEHCGAELATRGD